MTGHPALLAAFISASFLCSELEDPRGTCTQGRGTGCPYSQPHWAGQAYLLRGKSSSDSRPVLSCWAQTAPQTHRARPRGPRITAQLNTDQNTNAVQSTKMTNHHPPDSELTAASSLSTALAPRITDAGHRHPCSLLASDPEQNPPP